MQSEMMRDESELTARERRYRRQSGYLPFEQKPEPTKEKTERNSVFYQGGRVTGWAFGRGGDISVRVYDKTLELGITKAEAEGARQQAAASEKRFGETEIWARNGWQEGEPVTRVEVQLRGTGLSELCEGQGRCETMVKPWSTPEEYEENFEAMIDELATKVEKLIDSSWQYITTKWLRLVERTNVRIDRCPTQKWWQDVQKVVFVRPEPACKRLRKRTAAKSAQTISLALGLISQHGHYSPYVDRTGPIWMFPDERKIAQRFKQRYGADTQELERLVCEALDFAKPIIVRDLCERRGTPVEALEWVLTRWAAKTARYQPADLGDVGNGGTFMPAKDPQRRTQRHMTN